MLYYLYDKSFEGLFCCIFDAFLRKENPGRIVYENDPLPLFADSHGVSTQQDKYERVLSALRKKISSSALEMLYQCYLSELDNIELSIFNYIKKSLLSPVSIEVNFANEDVLRLAKVFKKMSKETSYMKQFLRFQKTYDGIFFAVMDPKYNVLPLCSDFFQDRYADQKWIIYDTKRKYGLYYDLYRVETISFDKLPVSILTGKLRTDQQDENEKIFQDSWNDYLKSITIQERKNLKLQTQHMPKRFWKYMTEKNNDFLK